MSKVKKTVALLLTFSLIFGVYQLHLQSLERQEARLSESFEDRVASLNRSYKERIGRVANESYREGFKDGNESGFSQGFDVGETHGYNSHPLEPDYNESVIINFTGSFRVNGYKIEFVRDMDAYAKAFLDENKIKIRTGRKAASIDSSCRHEIIHFKFPEYRHDEPLPDDLDDDSVYYLESRTVLPVCRYVTELVVNNNELEGEYFVAS